MVPLASVPLTISLWPPDLLSPFIPEGVTLMPPPYVWNGAFFSVWGSEYRAFILAVPVGVGVLT